MNCPKCGMYLGWAPELHTSERCRILAAASARQPAYTGRVFRISGFEIPEVRGTATAVELAAEMMADSLHLPDGTPVDGPLDPEGINAASVEPLSGSSGPRTTAGVQAIDYLNTLRDRPTPSSLLFAWSQFRNAAAYEGERYSQAIRGANEMRKAGVAARYNLNFHPRPSVRLDVPDPATYPEERTHGIPSWVVGTR